jgi:orotidine-5'-phosphate decarboxylase
LTSWGGDFFQTFVKTMNTNKTYADRAKQHPNACARSLFELMERKQTNLSVAVDVTTKKELLSIADAVGPYVCVLKVK